ncbi:YesL family protein [Bariatricus sp. SGI.154]|uniref:YesL family protein n=1 Tax=Bariatricus sp. SGI.154 TaxID=3420549 RepID=UPI003D0319A3
MNRLFNIDNPIMQFISKIFDLVILNLIFVLSCIPVITIGASLSALYYVSLKMLRGEEPYIWQNFWKAFRQNFKQSTIVWGLYLLIITFIGMDFYIINSQDTVLFAAIRVCLWVVCAILLSIFLYVFPIISHFVCTTKQAFKNAAFMAMGHLPYTIILLAAFGLILYLCTVSATTFALMIVLSGICGFSVVAFTYCIIFDRIFKKYEPEENSRQ